MEADCLYLLALCSLPSLVQDCGAFSFAFVTQQNRLPKLMPFSPASFAGACGILPRWWGGLQVLARSTKLGCGFRSRSYYRRGFSHKACSEG